jgi:hypothetical protein
LNYNDKLQMSRPAYHGSYHKIKRLTPKTPIPSQPQRNNAATARVTNKGGIYEG